MLSLLLTCREDSKFLAKFVTTFMVNTNDFNNVELLILLSPEDTWNRELLECFKDHITVIPDNTGIGRGGSHIFYSELAKQAKGDWLWYLCDDHYLFKDYDKYITDFINDNHLKANEVNVIAPAVSNSGRISHILSRKVYETIGFGQHGNVDSYINDTMEFLEVFIGKEKPMPYTPPRPIMKDYSLVQDLMKPKNKSDFNPIAQVKLFKSEMMRNKIKEDAHKLKEVI